MDLQQATAIVTGSAHRVGRAIAVALAQKGCNIIVHYGKSKDKAEDTVSFIRELGVEATAYSVDLRDVGAIRNFFSSINQNYDYQILVNSAASFVKKSLINTTLDDWEQSININTRAPLFMTKLAEPMLSRQNDSLIVNISDLSGVYPWKDFAVHGISKAALLHLTKIAARELAPTIRVNAILPGPILPPPHMDETDPIWRDMIENIPLKKSGEPKQIGDTVVYFAENEYITGATINVDGGEGLVGPKNH